MRSAASAASISTTRGPTCSRVAAATRSGPTDRAWAITWTTTRASDSTSITSNGFRPSRAVTTAAFRLEDRFDMASRSSLCAGLITLSIAAGFGAAAFAQQPAASSGQSAGAARREGGNGPTPLVTPETIAAPHEATIMPRDTLTIQTLDQPAFSGKFIVDLDGTFDFP